jgi:hypothetical protein
MDEIARLVSKFGEENRKLIEDSIIWLTIHEPDWKLDIPINREEFIKDLLKRRIR